MCKLFSFSYSIAYAHSAGPGFGLLWCRVVARWRSRCKNQQKYQKNVEKITQIYQKWKPNRPRIDEKCILGRFGRSVGNGWLKVGSGSVPGIWGTPFLAPFWSKMARQGCALGAIFGPKSVKNQCKNQCENRC